MPETDLLIQEADYVRQRWAPRQGDPSYLQLSDLRRALERFGSPESVRVLDFAVFGGPGSIMSLDSIARRWLSGH